MCWGEVPIPMKNALDTSWVSYNSTNLTLLELASEFQSSQFKGSVLQDLKGTREEEMTGWHH